MTATMTPAHLDLLEKDLDDPDAPAATADEVRLLIQTVRRQRAALEYVGSQANVLWDSGYNTARSWTGQGTGTFACTWARCVRAAATSKVCEVVNDVLSGRSS